MMDDAGLELLRSIEALMREVRDELKVSRDSRATSEVVELREKAAELDALRKSASERRKRNRDEKKSRDSRGTIAKPTESLTTVSRDSRATGDYRGKVVSASPEKQKQEPPTPLSQDSRATPKERVWAFWQAHLGKASHARFDKKRQRAVEARLRDGYTVDQLCEAIQGCKLDPFSMGKNDRHQRYDDLSLICRDAAHVDKFIALAPKAAPPNGAPRLAPWEQHAKEDEEVLARHGIGKAS